MSTKEKLQYVRVAPEKIDRFQSLFARAFQAPPPGYFKWKYLDNPAGHAVAYEALDGNTIAGFYGAMPELWMVRGNPVTLFQSMDTMTDPDYRGRGLFTDLAKLTMKAISDEHSGWMIGFPGHTSIGGFVTKLGWKDIAHVTIRFSLRQVLALKAAFRKGIQFELEPVHRAGPDFDYYWSRREARPLEIQKQYSAQFLNWRVFDQPGNRSQVHYVRVNGEISGVIVHQSDSNALRVQMWDFLNPELYAGCTAAVLSSLARRSNTTWVEMYEPNLPWARRACVSAGMVVNPLGRWRFSHHPPYIVWAGGSSRVDSDIFKCANYDMHWLVLDN